MANLPSGKVTALNVEAAKAHMISTGKLVIPVPMSMRMSFSVNRSDKLPEIRNLSVYSYATLTTTIIPTPNDWERDAWLGPRDLNVIWHNTIFSDCIALDCRAVSELRFHQSRFMAEHLHRLV